MDLEAGRSWKRGDCSFPYEGLSHLPSRNPNTSCLHPFRANLGEANLNGANLSVAHLNGADLGGAKLIQAHLLAPVVRSVERLTEPPDRFN
jgi:pentapeptide repeat protein